MLLVVINYIIYYGLTHKEPIMYIGILLEVVLGVFIAYLLFLLMHKDLDMEEYIELPEEVPLIKEVKKVV